MKVADVEAPGVGRLEHPLLQPLPLGVGQPALEGRLAQLLQLVVRRVHDSLSCTSERVTQS